MTRLRKAVGQSLAVLGVAGLAVAGAAGAAFAAVGPDQPEAPTEGSLTINKYDGAPGETSKPLSGVEFTITPVGKLVEGECVALDLSDAADWEGIEDLYPATAGAPAPVPSDPFCLVTADAMVRDTANGSIVIDPIAVGLYFVSETGDNADPSNNIVSKVNDFVISVPYSDNTTDPTGWNYDVVVKPKNQTLDEPTKTIEDQQELVVGSDVVWKLNVPIPTLNNNETFENTFDDDGNVTSYGARITDTLDDHLDYVSSVVKIGDVVVYTDVDGETAVTPALVEKTGNVEWTFTAAGLAFLNTGGVDGASLQGEAIEITLVTKVIEKFEDGVIPNDDYDSTFNGTTVPGEIFPYTYWGQLSILKTDDSTPALNLEGAEFQVFPKTGDSCPPAVAPELPAGIGSPVATGTSDADGVVQWVSGSGDDAVSHGGVLGLWVANSANGPIDPLPTKDYCVYETKVPSGHTAVAITNPKTITPGVDNINSFTVVNNKVVGPPLPPTGANGTTLMVIGGVALVSLAGGLYMVNRRKTTQA